ncbi:MAG: hypothetical protein HY592_06590 [Candidatus Omnitrophica bacterium]|nr:hypothetical protein [Candidatus Omnitrophota bacterium]
MTVKLMRWDLLDKFEVLKKGEPARAVKFFSGKEDFFRDHFPGRPLVPESLMIEMTAQAGGVLFGLGIGFKKEVILAKIEQARFERTVAPPCRLVVEAALAEEREEGAWVEGKVFLNKDLIGQTRFLLVTMDAVDDGKKNVVFNDDFMKHFGLLRLP